MRQKPAPDVDDPRLAGNDAPAAADRAPFGADAPQVRRDGPGEIGLGLNRRIAPASGDKRMGGATGRAVDGVIAQPPCTIPSGLTRCGPVSPSNTAKPSPISVSENDSVFMIGGVGDRPSSIAWRCSRPDMCRTSAGSATP